MTLNSQEQADRQLHDKRPRAGTDPYMVLDPVIEAVACARAKDMAVRNYFSHVNPDGNAINYLLVQAGYQLPAGWDSPRTNNYWRVHRGRVCVGLRYLECLDELSAPQGASARGQYFVRQWRRNFRDGNPLRHRVLLRFSRALTNITGWWSPRRRSRWRSQQPSGSTSVTTPSVGLAGDRRFHHRRHHREILGRRIAAGTSAWQTATGIASWTGTAGNLAGGANVITRREPRRLRQSDRYGQAQRHVSGAGQPSRNR